MNSYKNLEEYIRDIWLRDAELTEIPKYITLVNNLTGVFDVSNNYLTNLINSPKRVEHHYHCFGNPLTSLIGLPEYIGGLFIIEKETWDELPKDTNEAIYLLLNDKVKFIEDIELELYKSHLPIGKV